ncbi:MAG TPA: HD domain-containing protein [Polyangiaceae bacterium]|jgi:poly(A) polymerase|nr:HD domain-containing protein [Polyangiaceae bacterium]
MASRQELVTGSPDRAIQALDRAVAHAEECASAVPVVLCSPEDIQTLARPEVRKRLDRMMLAPRPDEGLEALLQASVLDCLFPEVKSMVGFGDGEFRHKDVWKHTKQVVMQAESRLEVRWSALFHDVGKIKTRSFGANGEVHFFGHAEVGARMFDKLERRERLFSPDETLRDSIRFLVLHHLRASQYDGGWTDSAVRRFAREMGPHLEDLLCLSRADITTKRAEKKRRGINMIEELSARISALAEEDSHEEPLPKGVGNAIMLAFGIPPSKRIGDIKRALEVAVEAGEIEPGLESENYVDYLAQHKARFGLI